MKKLFYFIIAAAFVAMASCGSKQKVEEEDSAAQTAADIVFEDDSTIYGLACDGCNDSVVVLLLTDGSDPVNYDILAATRAHKIIGQPHTGDLLALVRNPKDSTVADMVIDLDQLRGTWCYQVMPRLRDYDNMTPAERNAKLREMPDSVKDLYFVPREYGFTIKRQWAAMSVGMVQAKSGLEDESPVEYPKPNFYSAWHIVNGRLVMSKPAPGSRMMLMSQRTEEENKKAAAEEAPKMTFVHDTLDFVFMNGDSLVLRHKTVTRSYYRVGNAEDVNKLAREKAKEQAQKAAREVLE